MERLMEGIMVITLASPITFFGGALIVTIFGADTEVACTAGIITTFIFGLVVLILENIEARR